jgi:hypothetical protein
MGMKAKILWGQWPPASFSKNLGNYESDFRFGGLLAGNPASNTRGSRGNMQEPFSVGARLNAAGQLLLVQSTDADPVF